MNDPEPKGLGVCIRGKVDDDYTADTVTRRSRTGYLTHVNCALFHCFSKKQASVASNTFGLEFVAMKLCCEDIRGLRHELRMMGIPVEGPTCIEGENQSFLVNTTMPDSTLNKNNQRIAYHFTREGVARDEWRTTYVNTHENEADLLTNGEKRKGFVRNLLHRVFRTS